MDENGGNGKKREKNIFLFYNIKQQKAEYMDFNTEVRQYLYGSGGRSLQLSLNHTGNQGVTYIFMLEIMNQPQ